MKHIILAILCFFPIVSSAQKMMVSKVEPLPVDSTIEVVVDFNNSKATLLKVKFDGVNLIGEGPVVQQTKINENLYFIWVTSTAKMLRLKADNFYPMMIKFSDFDIKIDSNHDYIIEIETKQKTEQAFAVEEYNDTYPFPELPGHINIEKSTRPSKEDSKLWNTAYKSRKLDNDRNVYELACELSAKGVFGATAFLIKCNRIGINCKKSMHAAEELGYRLLSQCEEYQFREAADILFSNELYDLAFQANLMGVRLNKSDVAFGLARAYEQGVGVEKDLPVALQLYRFAAVYQRRGYEKALSRIMANHDSICSRKAVETQYYSYAGKGKALLMDEYKKEISLSNNYRDFPKIFAIQKALSDIYDDHSATKEVAKAYSGRLYPIKSEQLFEKYSKKACAQTYEQELKRVYDILSKYVDNDTIPFTDMNMVRIGDFLNQDATFTHSPNLNRKPIGMVFSLNVSKEEQDLGWSHGYVVSLAFACDSYGEILTDWATDNISTIQENVYKKVNNHTGLNVSYQIAIDMLKDSRFVAAHTARNHMLHCPVEITSGWYLPSAAQLKLLDDNVMKAKSDEKNVLCAKEILSKLLQNSNILTSTEASNSQVHIYNRNFGNFIQRNKYVPEYTELNILRIEGSKVLPIASF